MLIKDYYQTAKEVIFDPKTHIWNHKSDKNMGHSEMFLAISSFIAVIFFFTYSLLDRKVGVTLVQEIPATLLNSTIFIIVYLLLVFIFSGLLHLIVKASGGKESYIQTFKPLAYNSVFLAISMILVNLPFVISQSFALVVFVTTLIMFFGIIRVIGYLSHYTKVASWKFTLFFSFILLVVVIPIIGAVVMSAPW